MPELLSKHSNVTIVKNPGEEDMEIIIKKSKEIKHLEITKEIGRGKVVDTAYRLGEGKIIYMLYMPVEYKRR